MYTYMDTCDNTTDFPMDQSMTFLALELLHIKSKMAGVYIMCNCGNRKSNFLICQCQMSLFERTYFTFNMFKTHQSSRLNNDVTYCKSLESCPLVSTVSQIKKICLIYIAHKLFHNVNSGMNQANNKKIGPWLLQISLRVTWHGYSRGLPYTWRPCAISSVQVTPHKLP